MSSFIHTRVSKMVGGTLTTYLRSGAYVTDGLLRETSGSVATHHTPGISERRGVAATQYLHSGLKNADARTSGQAIDATRQYDAFGNLTSSSGTWPGPFGYAGGFGYQEDAESGLMLLGHRYYDSTTGRFLSKDPAADGRNWYAYCAHNPQGRADPDGNDWIVIVVDKGAKGHGTHARLGIHSNNPREDFAWYGFYSDGKMRQGDLPRQEDNHETVLIFVDPKERRNLQKLVLERLLAQHQGEKYNLTTNNCAQVIYALLSAAGIVSPGETEGATSIRDPEDLARHLQSEATPPSETPWWEKKKQKKKPSGSSSGSRKRSTGSSRKVP